MTPEQFAVEYEAGYQRTVRWLRRFGVDPQLVDDFAQQSWANAWRARDSFRGGSSFLTWVITIARNVALGHHRKKKEVLDDDAGQGLRVGSYESQIHSRIDTERILSSIPKVDADILREHFFEDKNNVDIGLQRNLSISGVKARVHRALLRTRAAVA